MNGQAGSRGQVGSRGQAGLSGQAGSRGQAGSNDQPAKEPIIRKKAPLTKPSIEQLSPKSPIKISANQIADLIQDTP